ncbi:uncharacterized protein PG998_010337 [Apiospora kogelbergensis]|uniref:uncharacterized protein n=1 Tax=Apiospora kogelbergensis TaxID=1337665 RepID=UPI00312F0BF2
MPVVVDANVTQPLHMALQDTAKFGSVSMSNLLHCVPGSTANKLRLFRAMGAVLDRDGVLTGYTVLSKQYAASSLSRLAV